MIRVSATWNDQGLSYLKWPGSQLPEIMRVSATWNDQGLTYLKCSGSQLPEIIRVTAIFNDQDLSYLECLVYQLPEMSRVSATWKDQGLSYLKWSLWPESMLPGMISIPAWDSTWEDEKNNDEGWKDTSAGCVSTQRVVSIVLQYKLSKVL